ncbi:MAG: hypothetical protein E7295_06965 [Lachnospiraceae bacterium]|jgi:tetratricopeptide (TPR) repeat protein|nr:hypothetical protein [Lachnospiraceae bacterium]
MMKLKKIATICVLVLGCMAFVACSDAKNTSNMFNETVSEKSELSEKSSEESSKESTESSSEDLSGATSSEMDADESKEASTKEDENSQKIAEYIEKAMNLVNDGKKLDANAMLDTAESLFGKNAQINDARFQIEKIAFIQEIELDEKEQNYTGAMKTINEVSKELKADEEVFAKTKVIEQYFVAETMNNVDAILHADGIDKALEELNMALKLLPNNEKLLAEREYIQQLRPLPFSLANYKRNKDEYGIQGIEEGLTGTDVNGYEVPNVTKISWEGTENGSKGRTLSYVMTGEYDKITGSVYLPFSWRKTDTMGEKRSKLEVWGDGNKIGEITAKNTEEPVQFSFDIAGIKLVELKCYSQLYEYKMISGTNWILLSNVCLEKNY